MYINLFINAYCILLNKSNLKGEFKLNTYSNSITNSKPNKTFLLLNVETI